MEAMNEQNSEAMSGATNETIAIATVPCQVWNDTYDLDTALKEGTIFPELNEAYFRGGNSSTK